MAALNQDETTDMRTLMALLDRIQRRGYTPPTDSTDEARSLMSDEDRYIGGQLELQRRRLHMLIQKKGYYPK